MELSPYLETLQRELHAAAAPGGPEVTRTAELLSGSLDAAARLCLLEALSDAAAEITGKRPAGAATGGRRGERPAARTVPAYAAARRSISAREPRER